MTDNDVGRSAGLSPDVAVPGGNPAEPDSVRLRLDLAYDGTGFSGWAIQRDRRTVQDELQKALARVLRAETATLTVAGRTDAGVHATGQVAHLDVAREAWAAVSDTMLRRLTGLVPTDIRVRSVVPVATAFDARFSALWRRYEYRICDRPTGADPLRRGFVLDWRHRLNVDAMNAAAGRMIGLADFAAFCKFRPDATTIRTLQSFTVVRDGEEILCRVQADAFCHSMVRSLVGALITVGEGRRAVDWPAGLRQRTRRADDVPVVGPHGLVLVEVGYPSEDELAARNATTRNRR